MTGTSRFPEIFGEILGAPVEHAELLSGGASRESWSVVAGRRVVVQIERREPDDARVGLATQAALIRAASACGVPVPPVVAADADDRIEGSYLVLGFVEGETIPRRILRDEAYASARRLLAAQCGEALARIHAIPPERVPGLDDADPLVLYRGLLDALGEPHPAFELGFRTLQQERPRATGRTIVHGDFRNGNLIVGPHGLRAVIDWELAHVGDPMEDLGWLCVKSWRFGAAAPVGGFGTREELFDAYARESGSKLEPEVVRWWEIFGTLRWGVICMLQAARHLSGAERSVELAAIGRRVCEVEWDLLELLP